MKISATVTLKKDVPVKDKLDEFKLKEIDRELWPDQVKARELELRQIELRKGPEPTEEEKKIERIKFYSKIQFPD